MTGIKHFFAATLIALLATSQSSASPTVMGPGSCSSSNCHGSIKPLNSSNVLQNEYITWSRHDHHSKAFLNLQNSDSKKIAQNLGIGDPTKEPLCLKCHATHYQDDIPKSEAFRLEDGVSCEACHGAAEGYLKSHAVTGTSHAENVANGLTDLSNIDTRATLCLSCHFGTEDKTVNHDLYGAGHPRLTFEIDTFGVLQPKHWVVDSDYEKRKGPYIPMRTWLIGQVHHAESALEVLNSPTRSRNGNLPELSIFDCFSCHHSLTEGQWKKRSYGGKPGQLRLNLPALVILKEVTTALNKPLGDELSTQLMAVHDAYLKDGSPEAISALETLVTTKVKKLVENTSTDLPTTTRVLASLTNYAANNPWPTFELAEQLGMGMQATIATSPELAKLYAIELKEMFGALRSAQAFKPEGFTAAAKKLNRSVLRP
jgi:hypothetical protein